MINRIKEIPKLKFPSDQHHCPETDILADLVTSGAKVSRPINDPFQLLGPKWHNFPPAFWPASNDKAVIDENVL